MPTMKISCTLLLLGLIQFADSLTQFSIPFVSWNKNKEEPSKLTFNIPNPFSSFGKNRQYDKSLRHNEVISNEKVEPVTPNPDTSYDNFRTVVQTTQDPRIRGIHGEKNQNENTDIKKDKQKVENRNIFKENEDEKENNYLTDDEINKIFGNYDSTTESTTEYESTTVDEYSDLYRSGVSGHVVATLLG